MVDASLTFALAAGMIAAFNPCGFAMLPAYLGFFVGVEGADPKGRAAVGRALLVGAAVTAGFALVFGLAGILILELSLAVERYAPWLTVIIGVLLVALGVAMVRGFEPSVRIPRLQRGGSTRGIGSMVLFGASYATVSLSCTLPIFLAATAGTFASNGFLGGMAVFGAYALGMGLVMTGVSVALALAHRSIVGRLRSVLPYVNRLGGALLVLAGAYVAYYGVYAIRTNQGAPSGTAPIDTVSGLGGRVIAWIERTGATRLALALGAAIAAAAIGSVLWRAVGRRRAGAGASRTSGG